MPPKKRKAAATAQPAAEATTPRARRGAPPDEKPTASATRSRRGTINAAEPEVELPTRKKPGRPAKAASTAAKPATAPAPAARRGRPPKNDKGADDLEDTAQVETRADPKPEQETRRGRGRGRPAKNAAEPASSAAPDPAPKRGRPGRKAAPAAETEAEVAEDKPEDKPKDAPKKRNRRSTLILEPVEEPPKELTATRGRERRVANDAPSKQETVEETEPPKRRGRPPGKDKSAKEEPALPVRRGRAAAAPAAETLVESAPKRRGRGATKAVEQEPETEQPKRRGRAAAKATDEEPAAADVPKKRGRPAAPKPEETVAEKPSTQTKKRGRPVREKVEDAPERPSKSVRTASVPVKKTTRAAAEPRNKRTASTAQPKAATKAAEAPKKRGRPAATQAEPTPKTNAKAPKASKASKAEAAPKTATGPKRPGRPAKAAQPSAPEPAKSTKRKRTVAETSATEEPQPKRRGRPPGSKNKVAEKGTSSKTEKAPKAGAKSAVPAKKSTIPKEKPAAPKPKADTSSTAIERDLDTGIAHWLMKAEPESRLENGVDVKFSIDDLAAATEPEAWDGVRNHVAKNNMMTMKKGDLAFFYHSNCKTPGIAGIMEIVEEAAPDESAFDSKHPYYDSKSSRDKPTWHCVKVAFRSKFEHPERLTLTALKPLAADDGPLANMQLFKQSRLSVSKVSRSEWDFITSHATGETEDLAADEPILVEKDVPEAPNGAANAEAGLEHADQVEDEHAASDSSEPSQAQPDDDQLELTIGTPKGAAALLEASEEQETDTTIADATLVTAQEESSIVQENGVTTATVTRETIVETSTVNDIEAAETGDDLPSEENDGEEDLSPSDDAEGEAPPSKPADGAEQQTVSWESSPPAQAVRSPSLQPQVEDAGEGDDVGEATQPGEEQGEPGPSNIQTATDPIAPNVSSSFGTSSGGVPNDENAPPSSFENNDHGNHATNVSASAVADLPVDDDLDASAMDFEMTGAAGFDDAAQKQVLAELEPSSASVAAAQQQQGEQSTGLPRGFGFGIFGGSNGL